MEINFLASLIGIVILIFLSAFFAGAETALTAASKVYMHAKEKEGNWRARLVNKVRERQDRMIGAMLLGNTVVHILASALATSLLIKIFGEAGVLYATGILTFSVLIFGEVLPKTYAVNHADRVALVIAPVVRFIIWFSYPVTFVVSGCTNIILRLFGADTEKSSVSHLELLRGTIEMHTGPEEETQNQRAMLRSILDLNEVDVGDIMIHRKKVTMVEISQPVQTIIDQVLASPYSRMAVWEENPDNIVGILHIRALLKALRQADGDAGKIDIRGILLEPWFIPETTTLHDQLQSFRERKEHFAIVVDEYSTYLGIVTLEDILEEIVGDIDDEHDVSVAGVRRVKSGVYIVDGTVTIRDLNREFEWGLPDEDYSTVAGLVIHESRMIPDVGQSFRFFDFQFDILRKSRNQITRMRMTAPPKLKI